nr:RNA 2',3'-cyclic phosphodiesterase [Candidatus Levybacteria bacterium]
MQYKKKKRIFVALGISKGLIKKIQAWREARHDFPVRWISDKDLHITIISPWYSGRVERVIEKVKYANIALEPFSVQFKKISFGPKPEHPRLIWAEGESSGTVVLENQLKRLFRKRKEKRDFLLHLTIARFAPNDFPSFPVKKLNGNINWKERINSFLIMESHLRRSGAAYEILSKIPFKRK